MSRVQIFGLSVLSVVGVLYFSGFSPTGATSTLNASDLLAGGHLWRAAGVVFLGGFLTSLTPCVYPLIPITVGVFGARQADSRARALGLTASYVVGMGLVFSALGVFAALSGRAFGSTLANPWLIAVLAAILATLAASMFGAFELALPTSLTSKLHQVGGGGYVGALIMGSVAGFLAAPCTGPVLLSVLAWVSQTRDPILGGLLLFTYALGIGVPFFLVGVFTVSLPKSGVWMEWVKSFFGIALLALAIGYVRDGFGSVRSIVEMTVSALGETGLMVTVGLLVFIGIQLGAIHFSFHAKGQRFMKGLGVTAVIAALMLRGASAANIGRIDNDGSSSDGAFRWSLHFRPDVTQSRQPFDEVISRAQSECKPVMIDFFADWCAACKELDAHTYASKEVAAEAKRFVSIKVDGTNEHPVLDALYEKFKVQGLPTVIFIDPLGQTLSEPRVAGFMPAEEFLGQMKKVVLTTCSIAR